MRKRIAWWVLAALAALVLAAQVGADSSLQVMSSTRTPLRTYVGATPQQYDTLAVQTNQRIELLGFMMFMDDSAMTPTLNVSFQSLNAKYTYFKITPQTFTANQQLVYALPQYGPIVFPKDSSIVIYYNITSTAPGTLDTLKAMATYRVERQ